MSVLQKLLIISCLFAVTAWGRARASGYCEQGGQVVLTNNFPSSTKVQQSYPACTVTVYYTGGAQGNVSTNGVNVTATSGPAFGNWAGLPITINSVPYTVLSVSSPTQLALTASAGTQTSVPYAAATPTPAAVYSDNAGTPMSNSFTASSTGYWFFYADNGTYDVRLSGAGIATPFTHGAITLFDILADPIIFPSQVEVLTGPNWSLLPGGIFYGLRSSINGFPIGQEFQGFVTPTAAGLDGAVDGGGSFAGALLGVSGYARTNFASPLGGTAAVGVFGAGYINAAGSGPNVTQAWGANFVSNNCGGTNCSDGQGNTNNNSYGVEIDMNMYKTAGGVSASNAKGLWITGGSTHRPAGIADAIDIGPLGIFNIPPTPWNNAVEVNDGAALVAFLAGTAQQTTSPSGCMPIRLVSRSSGGTDQYQEINCDKDGNLLFRSGVAGALIALQDVNQQPTGATALSLNLVDNASSDTLYAQNTSTGIAGHFLANNATTVISVHQSGAGLAISADAQIASTVTSAGSAVSGVQLGTGSAITGISATGDAGHFIGRVTVAQASNSKAGLDLTNSGTAGDIISRTQSKFQDSQMVNACFIQSLPAANDWCMSVGSANQLRWITSSLSIGMILNAQQVGPNGIELQAPTVIGAATKTTDSAVIAHGVAGQAADIFYVDQFSGTKNLRVDASGNVILIIPTSCFGIPAGSVINNAGVLNICP